MGVPARAGPALARHAGTCLWARKGRSQSQGRPSNAPFGSQGHDGETHVFQPSEGESKVRAFDAHGSWFDRVSLSRRMC